jgi:hypothetical protein
MVTLGNDSEATPMHNAGKFAHQPDGESSGGNVMTTLEVTLDLPDKLAREAQAAGLLTPRALSRLLKEAMRRRAAQSLLKGATRATAAGSKPLSMKVIQAEVNMVREARRGAKRRARPTHEPSTTRVRHQCAGICIFVARHAGAID